MALNNQGVGRPARISQEDVAEAALVIGLDKVTLKEIGNYLGVNHSSLYRHVKGRNDILLAAANRAFATLNQETNNDNWRSYLEAVAEGVWELYERYPGLAEVIRTMDKIPPSGIRMFSATCQKLETFGFSPWDAVLVMDSVMDMTNDSSVGWQSLNMPGRDGIPLRESRRQSWDNEAEKDQATATHVAMFNGIIEGAPKEWWRRKLSLLLDGAATKLSNLQA